MVEGLIGVVTVTYNSAGVLPDFLRCLFAQSHTDFRLFAVDNASSDTTIEMLNGCLDERLTVIANPDNRGVAEGNNQGIRAALAAGCSGVLLLNNDTEFSETLIEQLCEGMSRFQCDMICPKMLYFDEPARIWAAGGYFQPRLGYRALHYGQDEIDRGQFNQARRVTYVPTCCVLIRAELFDYVGLMDADYFVYSDDRDFMYRAYKAGATLWYLPEASLLHKVGRLTGGGDSPFSIRYATRNMAYFQLKHLTPWRAAFWIFLRRIHYMLKFLRRKDDFATLKLRLSATSEAWQMPRYKPRSP